MNNILEHVSAHDKETQAIIVAKVVDQNGKDFANEVTKNSREIQNDLKMTPFETASMLAGAGLPDNGGITGKFNYTLFGFSPVCVKNCYFKVDESAQV